MMTKMSGSGTTKNKEMKAIRELQQKLSDRGLRSLPPTIDQNTGEVRWRYLQIGITGGKGNNLIATGDMPAGTIIPIMGKIRTSLSGVQVRGTHTWRMQGRGLSNVYIDGTFEGSRGANVAMMANEPDQGEEEKQNAVLRHNCLILMRRIQAGEEILTDYGNDYHRTYPHDAEAAEQVMQEWGQTEQAGQVDEQCRRSAKTIRNWVMAHNFVHNIDELRYKKQNVKCYAVTEGRSTGVFTCWECVRRSTHKYSNAEQRGFGSEREAAEHVCKERGSKGEEPAQDWGAGLAIFHAINETTKIELPDEAIHRIVEYITAPHDYRDEDTRQNHNRCTACKIAAGERRAAKAKRARGVKPTGSGQ
jgi:hypothetical protein